MIIWPSLLKMPPGQSISLFNGLGLGLGQQAQFCGFERMLLCHRIFRSVQGIQNQPATEGTASAVSVELALGNAIIKEEIVSAFYINEAICSNNQGMPVTPTLWGTPVNTEVMCCPILAD